MTRTGETELDRLRRENAALTKVYVAASRLRQHPVPFDDHYTLVGAVDECRAVLEPAVDSYAPAKSAWQARVDLHPREEFLAVFREAHTALHRLWTDAVGKPGYDKPAWRIVDNALGRFARDAAETVGISRSEPLL